MFKVDPSWQPIINKAINNLDDTYLEFLQENQEYFPSKSDFLNAFKTLPLQKTKYIKPSIADKALLCKKHFHLLKDDKNEKQCVNLTKKHFGYYLKGFSRATEWRVKFMNSSSTQEIENLLDELINYCDNYLE